MKKTLLFVFIVGFFGFILSLGLYVFFLMRALPSVESLKNYKPPLASVILDRNGLKVGEFFKQRRKLTPYSQFPPYLIQAFVSAEDGRFFEHKGLNLRAIIRAFLVNLRSGRKVQGGSTITQQVARSLLLFSSEKTYERKLKEAVLATRIEKNLSKPEILYLYLNQIYLGHGAYGVGMAAEIYFRKQVKDLHLAECVLLAGLPQAPSRFSPIYNPVKAKQRQLYVLDRMVEENYIDSQLARQVAVSPLKVFVREKQNRAPYYVETIRQVLLDKIQEEVILTGGLSIKTAMDLSIQEKAEKHLKKGLRQLDKRQGFRGPLKQLLSQDEIETFFQEEEKKWREENKDFVIILPIDKIEEGSKTHNLKKPSFKPLSIFKAVVREVSDETNQVLVELPFSAFGILSLEDMKWARAPNPKVSHKIAKIKKPSASLKTGDVILVQIKKVSAEEKKVFLETTDFKFKTSFFNKKKTKDLLVLSLEQEPKVQGALLALDQNTGDILALVGGYDFNKSQFNRVYQATRQTGSIFKTLVYLAAIDKGFTPASLIVDAPVVYQKGQEDLKVDSQNRKRADSSSIEKKLWKPDNYGRHFTGDVLFRNALIRSMNVPTVKIIENIGIQWVLDYARRLGIFSDLNPDYTLALGSSSVTLYEMVKVFAVLGAGGKKINPLILHEVKDFFQNPLLGSLSLDERFREAMLKWEEELSQQREQFLNSNLSPEKKNLPPFFFSDVGRLISDKTAFIMTSLLKAVVSDPYGTGSRAKSIKRPIAGKTGTTNGYYDAWFVGYSPQISAGVWVGFDDEKSLGIRETGSEAALPIWLEFMKEIHENKEIIDFKAPAGIVFTHIDNETGLLVSPQSKQIVRQAFIEGTEPKNKDELTQEDEPDFLRQDLFK